MVFNIGVLIVITTLPDENRAVKITESLLQQKWVYESPTNWSLPSPLENGLLKRICRNHAVYQQHDMGISGTCDR